jgi:hypothetical protein
MNKYWITNPNNKKVQDCKSRTTGKLNYIHNKPVKEEFVYLPENYKYSSAIDYAGGKGILEVEVIK